MHPLGALVIEFQRRLRQVQLCVQQGNFLLGTPLRLSVFTDLGFKNALHMPQLGESCFTIGNLLACGKQPCSMCLPQGQQGWRQLEFIRQRDATRKQFFAEVTQGRLTRNECLSQVSGNRIHRYSVPMQPWQVYPQAEELICQGLWGLLRLIRVEKTPTNRSTAGQAQQFASTASPMGHHRIDLCLWIGGQTSSWRIDERNESLSIVVCKLEQADFGQYSDFMADPTGCVRQAVCQTLPCLRPRATKYETREGCRGLCERD